jgi:hypothetical protein
MVHQLVRTLEAGGESAAAELLAKLGGRAEVARELAYRLYTICERRKRAAEALSYNGRCVRAEEETAPCQLRSESSALPTLASCQGAASAGRR